MEKTEKINSQITDTKKILETLRRLEPLEEAGLHCFESTGEIPDFFQVYFLMPPQGFSSKGRAMQAQKNYRHVLDIFHAKYEDSGLSEKRFLPENINVELEHLLRYVDIFAHCHDFFELVCVLEGSCVHTVDRQDFTLLAGDLSIVPPQLFHHLKASGDCVCITIKIRISTFENTFSSLLKGQSLLSAYFCRNLYMPKSRSALTFHCGPDLFLQNLLLYMYAQQKERHAYWDNLIEGSLTVLFFHLLQNHQETLEFSRTITKYDQRIAGILDYLAAHYPTATLKDTAKAFYLSPAYLSASIRRATGQTFSQLLRSFRLKRAAELLTQTNYKLEKICEEIGYQDTTQFIRYFKEAYHCTPHTYRTRMESANSPKS